VEPVVVPGLGAATYLVLQSEDHLLAVRNG
jgi:hypothetical protein